MISFTSRVRVYNEAGHLQVELRREKGKDEGEGGGKGEGESASQSGAGRVKGIDESYQSSKRVKM